MRGKVYRLMIIKTAQRITPAHAGKSRVKLTNLNWIQDHPRTCGEKLRNAVIQWGVIGSPPHMRGKAKSSFSLMITMRITPAHAGKRQEK